jgi:hypothetical protein
VFLKFGRSVFFSWDKVSIYTREFFDISIDFSDSGIIGWGWYIWPGGAEVVGECFNIARLFLGPTYLP